ncbi:hypothetical protein DDZ13_05515 [Coraliomargarita sinensis]|uniref:Type I restriction modification DNA specificity domain-containing protein n=1 Tax=Coraliomargarita sinensis TaxID=2174842 RepID=A0A317ZMK4_9BACT|nr:restriction endonuclease subunit S [Coraliomargarita sinensis]PXA04631.1 hypothetical protein DDZ13_05515 [Coraliomargarita sinensis]
MTRTNVKLAELLNIKLGQSFRKTVLEDSESGHYIVQTKDILPGGRVSGDLMPMSTLNESPKPNVVQGDILVLCRGVRFNAGVVGVLQGPTTAQNMFHILRLKSEAGVLPEFVAAFINTPATQEHLKSMSKGATVQHLRVDDLGSLRIPIPPMEEQSAFVELTSAVHQEQQLSSNLISLRRKQLSALLGTL